MISCVFLDHVRIRGYGESKSGSCSASVSWKIKSKWRCGNGMGSRRQTRRCVYANPNVGPWSGGGRPYRSIPTLNWILESHQRNDSAMMDLVDLLSDAIYTLRLCIHTPWISRTAESIMVLDFFALHNSTSPAVTPIRVYSRFPRFPWKFPILAYDTKNQVTWWRRWKKIFGLLSRRIRRLCQSCKIFFREVHLCLVITWCRGDSVPSTFHVEEKSRKIVTSVA